MQKNDSVGRFFLKPRKKPPSLYRNNYFLYILKAFLFHRIAPTMYIVQSYTVLHTTVRSSVYHRTQYFVRVIHVDYQRFTYTLKSLYIQKDPIM